MRERGEARPAREERGTPQREAVNGSCEEAFHKTRTSGQRGPEVTNPGRNQTQGRKHVKDAFFHMLGWKTFLTNNGQGCVSTGKTAPKRTTVEFGNLEGYAPFEMQIKTTVRCYSHSLG